MPRFWSRPLPAALALLFGAATTLYSLTWMYAARREPSAFLGIIFAARGSPRAIVVEKVTPGSPAERAGLAPGDRILAIAGRPVVSEAWAAEVITRGRPGERLALEVERVGTQPLELHAVLGVSPGRSWQPLSVRVAEQILGSYPVLFLIALVSVLLLRPDDPNAWRLALLFASFIAGAPSLEDKLPPGLRSFSLAYKILFYGSSPAIFLYFFFVFPAPSALDRRAPWLKWAWLGVGGTASVALAAWAFAEGSSDSLKEWAGRVLPPFRPLILTYVSGGYLLGFASLFWSAWRGPAGVRRKLRVMLWGTVVGFGPGFVLYSAAAYLRQEVFDFPFWVWASCVMVLSLLPLSFAYAVVKERVLEIPILLRRSARYLLVQRGSLGLILLAGAAVTLYFSLSLGQLMGPGTQTAAVGLSVGFGTVLVWTGSQVQRRVSDRIDRAFFRSAYDARLILNELAEMARGASRREDLAALLVQHVRSALLPRSLAVYVEARDGALRLAGGDAPAGPEVLPASSPLLADLARSVRPKQVSEAGDGSEAWLSALGAECLVPIVGRGRLNGLLVLGPRLSDEPYSSEDRILLASVASQAGFAFDSIRLAEEIADRLEAERFAAHERELAHRVQSHLLPQQAPALRTLVCAGRCVQARAVGGDYYDFLEPGGGRVGLVLADVSGKGFPAALLMASLQASLRSRSGEDLLDLPRQLQAVNQLLYRSSESGRFATLFLAVYDDATRSLVYANCGHNPPLVLRAGAVERLAPTAPVLGMFEEWECRTATVRLGSGELLAIYSDGITEAFNPADEEFGEARLIEVLLAHGQRPVGELISSVLDAARAFSSGEQQDDQTLLLARGL